MPREPRLRYQIRVRRAVAGSFLAASSAVSIAGLSGTPAVASGSSSVGVSYESPADTERLTGVKNDLANAVAIGHATQDQADAFYAQIERRVLAGR